MKDDTLNFEMDALDDLLEAERSALLSGNLEQLSRMLESKEALISALNQAEHNDLDALKAIDSKVKRNQQLLDGALEGIRSVARRMAALRRIRGSLDTYDSSGKKHAIDVDARQSVEKRA